MYDIPRILSSQELIDKAFRRAKKHRLQSKVIIVTNVIDSTLSKYIRKFPSFDKLHPFYHDLINVSVGIDNLKKSLGALNWCKSTVKMISERFVRNRVAINIAYGRIASIVTQISDDLEFLQYARDKLTNLPAINTEIYTIVLAGYPNVGKSQLVSRISSANPKIASYPFTTTGISIGHFEYNHYTYQIVDTPGLLDRDFSQRSKIEKQAVLALQHLADVIVFLVDPVYGYPIEHQLNLLERFRTIFNIPTIVVENKVDLHKTSSNRLKISALTGKGIHKLLKKIELYRKKKKLFIEDTQFHT